MLTLASLRCTAGVPLETARRQIWLVDSSGLIYEVRCCHPLSLSLVSMTGLLAQGRPAGNITKEKAMYAHPRGR